MDNLGADFSEEDEASVTPTVTVPQIKVKVEVVSEPVDSLEQLPEDDGVSRASWPLETVPEVIVVRGPNGETHSEGEEEFVLDDEIRARTQSVPPAPPSRNKQIKKRHSEQSLLKVLQRKKKMEMRSNASTEDLIALAAAGGHKARQRQGDTASQSDEIGPDQSTPPYPNNPDGSLASFPSATSLQSSRNTTPRDSPKSTPSTTRKVKPALKLTLEDSTWTPPQRPKPSTSTKIRKNIQSGAAKVNKVVQLSRTPEFRFRLVLFLLFSFIVSTVTFTWYLYQKQMLQLTIGDKIKFMETRRILNFLRDDGGDLMKGTVGLHIPPELSPYDCQSLRRASGPNICMEWKYRARLQINVAHETNVSCYTVHWESLEKGTILKDCFNLRGAHWYGMGELRNSSWPFRNTKIKMQAMVTGDLLKSDFGGILERYWLSSSGIGIRVESYVPLFVSLNATGDDHLCFESHFDEFPYKSPSRGSLPTLEYTICTGPNTKAVHESMMKQFAVLPSNLSTTEFMQAPLWSTWPKLRNHMTQEALKNFSHHIIQHGFDDPGFIFFDESWQNKLGDLEFKSENIPNPENILQVLRNKGFKILMTVHPYVCLDSEIFPNATAGNYLVSDAQLRVPLLTRWPESNSICAIIDLTKNASSEWFVNKLKELKSKYTIDGFFFLGGQSTFLPHSYHFNHSSVNPDEYLHHYADTAANVGTMTGLSFGFKSQNKLSFVRLAPRQSTWDSSRGLQSVIPTVLNLGLLGYPLVNPGSVGGDEIPGINPEFDHPGNRTIPDNELYLRWLQMVVFLPVVQFSVPPADYGLDGIKVAKVLLTTRKKKVFPVIQRCLREFLATGAPIVRPLWWLAPNDPTTYGLENQFAIGDEIIVAPVTEPGKRNREVYLPQGFWKDENQATTWRGGRWHHNYSVPLEKVAYFIRTDDPKIKGEAS